MSPEGYSKYPIVEPFEAENEIALKELIDNYLETLMQKINEPLKICTHCHGRGYEPMEEGKND